MSGFQTIKIIVSTLKALGAGSQKEIGQAVGYTNESAFSQVLNGKTPMPPNLPERLLALDGRVKEIVEKTLGKDISEALSEPSTEYKKLPRFDAEPLRLADPYGFEATGEKFYTLPDGSRVMQIPVIPIKAWGSYPRGYGDPEYYEGFETITVPVNQLHKGMYLAWEVKDDSMVNIENHEMARKSIWPRQKIVGREIRREAWQYKLHISPDEAWVVVHKDDGITVKEISEHDTKTGIITLHSWNPDKEAHPDFQWHLDDIQQIFHVVDPFAKMRPY